MAKKKGTKKQDPLSQIVLEYGGIEIFSEENYSRLNKALMALDDSFAPGKDWLLIANMKHIPQKLYVVRDMSQNTIQKVAEECRDVLVGLGIGEDNCETIVQYYMSVLGVEADVKKSADVKAIIGSFNYADCDYKTCQIGDKIWFAENFNFEKNPRYIKGTNANSTVKKAKQENILAGLFGELLLLSYGERIGSDSENKKYGRLYKWNEAHICAPEGWRLPTLEDFQDMVAYIESLRYDAGTALKSKKQWHGGADDGLDLFGFCAFPTARDSETGESQAWFWTASETGDQEYPHYCVCLSANSNDVGLRGKAPDDYYACVRYVKDVD